TAGLDVGIAIVCVGPPRFASSASCGFVFAWSPAAPRPHWFVLSMLKPPEANAPVTPLAAAQFWPLGAELLEMIVSSNVYGPLEPVPCAAKMPPPGPPAAPSFAIVTPASLPV